MHNIDFFSNCICDKYNLDKYHPRKEEKEATSAKRTSIRGEKITNYFLTHPQIKVIITVEMGYSYTVFYTIRFLTPFPVIHVKK